MFKRTLFIGTKHNMQIFRVILFIKMALKQLNDERKEKWDRELMINNN